MTTILFIWMTVAASNAVQYSGWVNSGEFRTYDQCVKAAAELGIVKPKFRCVEK